MAASEEVLRAFNDILDIKVAYTWGPSQILTFMGHVVANGFLYDIQDSELLSLKAMVDEIHMLCPPDGATFSDPVIEPCQSNKRALNPIWQRNAPSQGSKFLLQTLVHNKVPFSGIYDILGLFLSSIGAAPNRATTRNFYLPMTAMYAKWCIALSEFVPKKLVPTMYNSTWVKDGPGKGRFFLGASLGGYIGGTRCERTGTWAQVVKEARWNLINDGAMHMSGYSMYDCPLSRSAGDTSIGNQLWFGNCAEVYPLLHVLRNNPNPAAVHGIALRNRGVDSKVYEDNLSGQVWTSVRDLCENCEVLVRMWGGLPVNFDCWADVSGAPP